ncbi:MAG: hypothetical protein AAF235_07365, partial [Planctomycetota bacterium]
MRRRVLKRDGSNGFGGVWGRAVAVSALLGACGAAVAASVLAGGGATAPADDPVKVKVIGSDGVEHELDPSTVGIDFAALARAARGGGSSGGKADSMPKWKDVSEGFEKVISTADGRSFFNLYVNKAENKMLAE